jgi:deoxyribodipyrimidine photo-lyase
MIQPERIQALNDRPERAGRYVLHWMQAAQRARGNHALAHAVREADRRGLPVVAYFGLTESYPAANARHFAFLLAGLAETRRELADRGIRLVVRRESPQTGAVALAREAALTVVDAGYLRHQRAWREAAAARLECPFVQVETDVVVPVTAASPKEEFSAATFRPKLHRALPRFLAPLEERAPRRSSLGLDLEGWEFADAAAALAELAVDRSVGPIAGLSGGYSAARHRLEVFLGDRLADYPERRNDPTADALSGLSPYLHFGQIGPLEVALAARATGLPAADVFLEELVVRRELAVNYAWYNPAYDRYEGLPAWARASLAAHAGDRRATPYTVDELERAATHDPYWNAAQTEMVRTGKMHGYMRMYWGKKILEWSATPEAGFAAAVRLNDKYELDGRDANGYAGVAWCFGKHDRPWKERPVFGKIRCMVAGGLRRKFDADAYAVRWSPTTDQ